MSPLVEAPFGNIAGHLVAPKRAHSELEKVYRHRPATLKVRSLLNILMRTSDTPWHHLPPENCLGGIARGFFPLE
jgi:hypothetical protein